MPRLPIMVLEEVAFTYFACLARFACLTPFNSWKKFRFVLDGKVENVDYS